MLSCSCSMSLTCAHFSGHVKQHRRRPANSRFIRVRHRISTTKIRTPWRAFMTSQRSLKFKECWVGLKGSCKSLTKIYWMACGSRRMWRITLQRSKSLQRGWIILGIVLTWKGEVNQKLNALTRAYLNRSLFFRSALISSPLRCRLKVVQIPKIKLMPSKIDIGKYRNNHCSDGTEK